MQGAGWLWVLEWGAKPISLAVYEFVAQALIHGKWRKLQSALFGVIAGSFLGKL
jgi:hypothetical protein